MRFHFNNEHLMSGFRGVYKTSLVTRRVRVINLLGWPSHGAVSLRECDVAGGLYLQNGQDKVHRLT